MIWPKLEIEELRQLWQSIKGGQTPEWTDGRALEYLIVRLFEIEEATVTYPFPVASPEGGVMEQLDGFVQSDGINALLEAKDYKDRINVEPIAKLRNQLARRPAGLVGCIFGRSGFTSHAITLASYMAPQAILLWTGEEIDEAVNRKCIREGLRIKYSRLLRDGMPYYDFRGESQ